MRRIALRLTRAMPGEPGEALPLGPAHRGVGPRAAPAVVAEVAVHAHHVAEDGAGGERAELAAGRRRGDLLHQRPALVHPARVHEEHAPSHPGPGGQVAVVRPVGEVPGAFDLRERRGDVPACPRRIRVGDRQVAVGRGLGAPASSHSACVSHAAATESWSIAACWRCRVSADSAARVLSPRARNASYADSRIEIAPSAAPIQKAAFANRSRSSASSGRFSPRRPRPRTARAHAPTRARRRPPGPRRGSPPASRCRPCGRWSHGRRLAWKARAPVPAWTDALGRA